MAAEQAKITIHIGATVRVTDQNGSTREYVFLGGEGGRLVFRDGHGATHYDVLAIPYTQLEIKPPPH